MRILTYKRTHVGDPDRYGRFGIYDCMGRVRTYDFEAVIGIGGTGGEPKGFGIDRKINWVGCFHGTGKGVSRYESAEIEGEGQLKRTVGAGARSFTGRKM